MPAENPHNAFETLPPPPDAEVVDLHQDLLEIPASNYLYDRDATRKVFGINGSVVAELVLPTGNDSEVDKLLGIIDFGEDVSADNRVAVMYDPGLDKAIPSFGKTSKRYGLIGLNYFTKTGRYAYISMNVGEIHTIGRRDSENDNHRLGLADLEAGTLSPDHLSILVTMGGKVEVQDHSKNHTEVVMSKREQKSLRQRALGRLSTRNSVNRINWQLYLDYK